jgi:CBS domain-containing protein
VTKEVAKMTAKVRDVMRSAPVGVRAETPFKEIAEIMADRGISALPVLDVSDRVIGVVSEADLIVRDEDIPVRHLVERRSTHTARRKARASTAAELMTSPAIVVGPETSLADAAATMRRYRVKRLPVCDAHGGLLGVVSRIDLVRQFTREDVAILGDVRRVMAKELSIPPTAVRAAVHDGVVWLEGTVEHEAEVQMVVDRIRHVSGVIDVETRLSWTERPESDHPRVAPMLDSWARN